MKRWSLYLAIGLSLIFALAFSWYNMRAFNRLNVHRFDMGNMEQLVWNVTQGHGFVMTDPYGTATVSRFAFHVDPFIALLAIPYAAVPRTETLILLQVLFVASGCLAAYFLGRHIVGRGSAGLVAAIIYAISAPVQWTTIFPIHAVTFALPMILWMVLAALKKRYWWMAVLALLIILTKEQVGFTLAIFGAWLWIFQRARKWGPLMTFVPLVWSLVAMLIILPHYAHQTTAKNDVYNTNYGSTVTSIISGAVKHPGGFMRSVINRSNIIMTGKIIAGNGALALGSPISLAAVPDLIINGLSLKPQQHELKFQYNDTLWPWLIVGTLMSWAMLERRLKRWPRSVVSAGIVIWLIGWSVAVAFLFGPLPGTPNDRLKFATWRNTYAAPVIEWSKKIPTAAKVAASNSVGAHFARREHLYLFALQTGDADYVVALQNHGSAVDGTQTMISQELNRLKADANWEVLASQGDLTVLHRRASPL